MEIELGREDSQGSLEKGLSGDYEFSLGGCLGEAWDRVGGNKARVWKALLLYIGLAVLISLFFTFLDGGPKEVDSMDPPSLIEMIGNLVSVVVLMPMGVGLAFYSTAIVLGHAPNPKSLFAWYDNTLKLFITYVLMSILIFIGILLLVLPGIYLAVSYQLALPLVADKKLGPWQAMEASRKIIGHSWFSVLGFDLVLAILLGVSATLLGIPLIWTLPLAALAFGILYRTMVGIEPDTLHRTLADA